MRNNFFIVFFVLLPLAFSYSQELQSFYNSSTEYRDIKISFPQNDDAITKTTFKPERFLYEIAVGAAASSVGAILGGAIGGGFAKATGDSGPFAGLAHIILGGYVGYCIGSAGGVYLVAKKYNSNIEFYETALVALSTGGISLFALYQAAHKNPWYFLSPLPVTILFSQIFYPTQIEVQSEQQVMHGQIQNNFTLSIPIGN